MEYIYGTIRRDGVMVENLKTVGAEHTALAGYIETRRDFGPAGVITDRCRILEHYQAAEAEGVCYDWYLIDQHYRHGGGARGAVLPLGLAGGLHHGPDPAVHGREAVQVPAGSHLTGDVDTGRGRQPVGGGI